MGQALPQAPQLRRSDAVLMQRPPQRTSPIAHWQVPATQLWPAVQLRPQLPQLVLSMRVSTQELPHTVRPAAQEVAQVPPLQTWPVPQAVPQVPQFVALERVSTQTPPQRVWPAGQVQTPATQVEPPAQLVPHMPQFVLVLLRSTHAPLHAVRPAPQVASQVPLLQT